MLKFVNEINTASKKTDNKNQSFMY